jgi:hypothetical protein
MYGRSLGGINTALGVAPPHLKVFKPVSGSSRRVKVDYVSSSIVNNENILYIVPLFPLVS